MTICSDLQQGRRGIKKVNACLSDVQLLFETRHPVQLAGAADSHVQAAGQEVSQEIVAGFMEVVIAAMAR